MSSVNKDFIKKLRSVLNLRARDANYKVLQKQLE